MSYILEALRKSDQQRRHDPAPMARLSQPSVSGPRRHSLALIVIAAALLGAGLAIGLVRPWPPPPQSAEKTGEPPPLPVPATPPVVPEPPVQSSQPAGQATAAQPATAQPAAAQSPAAPGGPAPAVAAPSTGTANQTAVLTLDQLPAAVRQSMPPFSISMHAYSGDPAGRIVMIDNRLLREGDYVAPGLRLEQITPDGVIVDYRGYRIQRPAR